MQKVMKLLQSTISLARRCLLIFSSMIPQGKYKYCDAVEAGEDSITVNGKTIKIYAEKGAKDIPWGKHDVDVVLRYWFLHFQRKGFCTYRCRR